MTGLEAEKIPSDMIFSFSRRLKGWEASLAMEGCSPKGCFTSLVQLKGPHCFPLVLANLPLAKQSAGPLLWGCVVAWY